MNNELVKDEALLFLQQRRTFRLPLYANEGHAAKIKKCHFHYTTQFPTLLIKSV